MSRSPVPSGRARPPLALTLPALAAVLLLGLPLLGVLARTPWRGLPGRLTEPAVLTALRLSAEVSFAALGISLLLGVPLAWVLARHDFRGKALVRSLVLLPMVLPPTVAGVALLLGFGRDGLVGRWLHQWFGLTLPFSTTGTVLAATFVAMPFLVLTLEGALEGLHPRFEEAAASLGAGPLRVFGTVTLPVIGPALLAGAALTWARALGEFGATITFAGNLEGVTQTLPLQVYLLLQDDPEAATAVSLLLLVVAMAVLLALRGRWLGGRRPTGGQARVEADAAGHGVSDVEGHAPADATSTAVAPPAPEGRWALHAELSGAVGLVLDAEPGSTVAVVGPNGAGKTTLLRALLGLTPRARATRLGLGEREVAEHATHRRGIAWVPQDGALLPHLSALDNTAYGPRAQGVPRAEARAEARAWLDRLGVGQLTARRPGGLSGGQAGRVALARALAARPRLLLLDEPLAALDQGSRVRVRQALREHLAGFGGVCLLVTHDPVEAVSLADRVLVLQDGRVVQDAAPAEVVRHPRSPWVARMLGRNALAGTFGGDGRELELPGGARVVAAEAAGGSVDGSAGGSVGGSGLAVVGPEAVSLHRERPEGSPRNVWSGQVRELTAVGGRVRVLVGPDGQGSAESVPEPGIVAEVTPGAVVELELAEGLRIWLSVKATEVALVAL